MCDREGTHLHINAPGDHTGSRMIVVDPVTPASHAEYIEAMRHQIGLMKEAAWQEAGNPQAVFENFPTHLKGITLCLEITLNRLELIDQAERLADASRPEKGPDADDEITID